MNTTIELEVSSTAEIEHCIDMLREVMRVMRVNTLELPRDLTMAQMRVLMRLHGRGSSSLKQLAEEMQVSPPSMSASVEKLVRSELVERTEHPDDRRFVVIQLTTEGTAIMNRVQQGKRARIRTMLEKLEPAQVEALESALNVLVEKLREE